MELTDDILKLIGGGAKTFDYVCPYCKEAVRMSVSSDVVTCLECKKTVLDLKTVHRRKKTK